MWVFWSSVVCLGLMVIGLFAVFEKRRNDVRPKKTAVEPVKEFGAESENDRRSRRPRT